MDFPKYWVVDAQNSFTEAAAKCCSGGSQKSLCMESSKLQHHPCSGMLWVIPREMIFPGKLCNCKLCSCSLADLLSAYRQWLPEAMHQELALKWPPAALCDSGCWWTPFLQDVFRAFQGFPWNPEADGLTSWSNTCLEANQVLFCFPTSPASCLAGIS